MKQHSRLASAAAISLFSALSVAADWSGTVSLIKVSMVSPAVLFQLSGELKSPARCNEEKMYAVDLGAPGGEAIFELLKYAYINKLPVEADSLGTCAVYWKAEGVKNILLR